jgi:hypothetical protein
VPVSIQFFHYFEMNKFLWKHHFGKPKLFFNRKLGIEILKFSF